MQLISCCVVWRPLTSIGTKFLELNLKCSKSLRKTAPCVTAGDAACGILRAISAILYGRNIARMPERSWH